MSRKVNVSHNACYDFSRCRWNLQPADMVKFFVRDDGISCIGEVISVSLELVFVRRLKDNRIFVISTFDMKDWKLSSVDYVRRLPNGIFQQGERVCLEGDLDLPGVRYFIVCFDRNRVKISCYHEDRFIGCYFVREGEILKYLEVK